MDNDSESVELDRERRYFSALYERLDAECAEAASRVGSALPYHDDLWQRDAAVAVWSRRLSRLRAAEDRLCFGRVDRCDGGRSYIGRVGLFDDDDGEQLLLDWRAPAARPFYSATAVAPDGVRRRRHFRTRGRTLLDFHDEVFDESSAIPSGAVDVTGALLTALEQPRGTAMRDVVATLQAEQDAAVRHPLPGVLLLDGGPGTGKTAVALHRVAYLLYHHSDRLARRGVLVVGPSSAFVRYIGSVLPALGETDVVFTTPGALFPGVRATAEDEPVVARMKGDAGMVDVLSRAVADRRELPSVPIEIALDDVTLVVDETLAFEARGRALASGLRHNPARRIFRETLGTLLVRQAVALIGEGWLEPDDPSELSADLAEDVTTELRYHPGFHDLVERLWPALTPQRLLGELFTSHERLTAISGDDASGDLTVLYRNDPDAWTVSDAALLDEAAELLGQDTTEQDRAARTERRTRQDYAAGVLRILDTHDDPDEETLRAGDVVGPDALAEQHDEPDHRDLADRAAADRTWTFGHLVVDEAQELSAMAWRVLARRCPSRSATIVGDLAQRHSAAAGSDWSGALESFAGQGFGHRHLTINYRTPAPIMDLATRLLPDIGVGLTPPTSIRGGDPPRSIPVEGRRLSKAVGKVLADLAADERSVAIVAARTTLREIGTEDATTALTPREAKGLEFDDVVIVEPTLIYREHPSGPADLYVALTRATQRVVLLHSMELPSPLRERRGEPRGPSTSR